jgi:hypothetical protein
MSLHSSWILNLMRIKIQLRLLTLLRIRIRLYTLIRSGSEFPNMMRICIRNGWLPNKVNHTQIGTIIAVCNLGVLNASTVPSQKRQRIPIFLSFIQSREILLLLGAYFSPILPQWDPNLSASTFCTVQNANKPELSRATLPSEGNTTNVCEVRHSLCPEFYIFKYSKASKV